MNIIVCPCPFVYTFIEKPINISRGYKMNGEMAKFLGEC